MTEARQLERVHQLFLLNLCLQLFDGIATWQGMHLFGEGNPLLLNVMPALGAGTTLLLYKAKACGLLVLLRRLGAVAGARVGDGLVILATVYVTLSFVPWMWRIVHLVT
jgi:hypothetical protein